MKKLLFIILLFVFGMLNVNAANNYGTGDEVKYKDMNFYVVSNHGDYYTLMKKDAIKSDEISSLVSSTEIADKININDTYVKMAYYTRENCGSSGDISGCTSDYELSYVKQVVDVWANNYLNSEDLVKDKLGYSARLLKGDDIVNDLYYKPTETEISTINAYYEESENTPNYNLKNCWTMEGFEDFNKLVLSQSKENSFYPSVVHSKLGTVCPVINILKSNIENKEVVNTPDTYLKEPYISTIIGGIVILAVSIAFTIYIHFYKLKINKK